MSRLIKIVYGSIVLGKDQTSTSYVLTGRYRTDVSYDQFSVEFEVEVRHATRATFLADEATLLAEFRKPDQALAVSLGSTARHSYDPAANTGFNQRATYRKTGQDDTANSATYAVRITAQLPADLSGRSGRQTSTVEVRVSPAGYRTVVIQGAYTALSSNSAKAQYTAAATTYCESIITALQSDISGNFQLQSTGTPDGDFTYDDQNKVLHFRRVYVEQLHRQSLQNTVETGIRSPNIQIERLTPPDPSDPDMNTRPLERVRATYEAWVHRSVATPAQLESYYYSTIRPLLIDELNLVAGTTVVVMQETGAYLRYGSQVRAVIEAVADLGAQFYEARLEISDYLRLGKALVPVWSGDEFARDKYPVPAYHRKVVQRFTVARTTQTFSPRIGIPEFPGFEEMEQLRNETRSAFGVTGDQIPYAQVTHTFVFERANISSVTGGGGSGGGSDDGGGTRTRGGDPMGWPQ